MMISYPNNGYTFVGLQAKIFSIQWCKVMGKSLRTTLFLFILFQKTRTEEVLIMIIVRQDQYALHAYKKTLEIRVPVSKNTFYFFSSGKSHSPDV